MWSELIRLAGIKGNAFSTLPILVRKVMWHFCHLSVAMNSTKMHPRDEQILKIQIKMGKLEQRLKEPLTAARRQATIQAIAQQRAQPAHLFQNHFWRYMPKILVLSGPPPPNRVKYLWKASPVSLMQINDQWHSVSLGHGRPYLFASGRQGKLSKDYFTLFGGGGPERTELIGCSQSSQICVLAVLPIKASMAPPHSIAWEPSPAI